MRATARHGYFRLRDEGYTPADLERWADDIAARAARWDDVFVYFKHEDEGKGPEFAACDVLRESTDRAQPAAVRRRADDRVARNATAVASAQ